MKFVKYSFLLTAIFGALTVTLAQNIISPNAFLSSASQQTTVQIASQNLQFQTGQDAEMSWLEELEIRTETNDFEWQKQEFTIRMTPNTKRQRNAQKNYHQAITELSKTEQKMVLKKALFIRYKWLADWLVLEQKLDNKTVLKSIYIDKLTVLKRKAGDLDFKIKDLVKAEEDLLEVEAEISELKSKQQQMSNAFSYLIKGNDTLQWDKKTMITTDQILNKMALQSLDTITSLALKQRINQMDILDQEAEIETSKIRNPINYAQVKVGGNPTGEFREYVSIGMGFNLPLKRSNQLDFNKIALEKLETSGKYILLKEKLENQQKTLIEKVKQLVDQKIYLENQIKNSQAVFVLDKLLKLEGADPMDILDIKEIIIKKEQKREQIDLQILNIYVEWLAISNKMMERPLQNHLVAKPSVLPLDIWLNN